MTSPQLLAWILALPAIPDGNGIPIARKAAAAQDIATVCAETSVPVFCAATLDVLAAKESGYRTRASGDCPGMHAGSPQCTRELGARSCGAFQTPCARTPSDGLGQVKLAWSILLIAVDHCAEHPLWMYARGECKFSATASRYEALVRVSATTGTP